MGPTDGLPLARTDDLVVQEANEETLVYDKKYHLAHCLNRLAALVWRHCDGRRGTSELAVIVHKRLGIPVDPEVVELTLQELAQANLLQGRAPVPHEQRKYSRRELNRRMAGAGTAAFLLAPVVTIMTQTAMAHASPPKAPTTAAPGAPTTKAPTTSPPTTRLPTTIPPTTTTTTTTTRPIISDRNLKEGFASVNGNDVLGRLAGIAIETWSYKSDDPSIRHIGPMAQDFAAAFGMGADDRHIHAVDASGVALAAIQALYHMLQEKDNQISALWDKLDELQQRVADYKSPRLTFHSSSA